MVELYESDPFCCEFQAKILSCTEVVSKENEVQYEVELNQTAFYPEGGGQPWDLGTLGNGEVLAVRKRQGKIIHTCTQTLQEGECVVGKLDWQRRFDFMQQHSGEHIVSGFAHSLFGCENVGFHMGKDFMTIDFDVFLNPEQIQELETRANQYIWENHTAEIDYYQGTALEEISYRSKKEIEGMVRIVRFPQADTCACCGTHVENTGQVGLVKIFSCQKFREGVRLELLCGRRALEFLSVIRLENTKISQLLSAKPLETGVAVERFKQEKEKQSSKLMELEKFCVETLVKEQQSVRNPVVFLELLSTDGLRFLATELANRCDGVAFCFLNEGDGFRYAVATAQGDVRPVVKNLNQKFSGRGGGKEKLAQGSISGNKEEIQRFIAENVS